MAIKVNDFVSDGKTLRGIRNPLALAKRLVGQKDPPNAYLWTLLTPATKKLLQNRKTTVAQTDKALSAEIGRLLERPHLYRGEHFRGVNLSRETAALANQNLKSPDLERFNWLLLQDVYPAELGANCLGEIIKQYRSSVGLSARELSEQLGLNKQFIAGVERTGQTTFTSLRQLVEYFTSHPDLRDDEDKSDIAVRLVEAALNMDLGVLPVRDRNHDLALQQGLKSGDHVWLISDVVAELQDTRWCNLTAQNLIRGITYTYFLPSTDDCQELVNRLRLACLNIDVAEEAPMQHLKIFWMDKIGFFSRMRIVNPHLPKDRRGVYLIRTARSGPKKLSMSNEQLERVVGTLQSKMADYELKRTNNQEAVVRQIYPEFVPRT